MINDRTLLKKKNEQNNRNDDKEQRNNDKCQISKKQKGPSQTITTAVNRN